MRTKICGIATQYDVQVALASGADALGFLIGLDYETDDQTDQTAARQLIRGLPPFVASVLVTHRLDLPWVLRICEEIGVNTVQMHGPTPAKDLQILRSKLPRSVKLIQAVHVVGPQAVTRAKEVSEYVDALLLDTKAKGRLGGTGMTHDWTISQAIVEQVGRPVILAGGLTPENVAEAITMVRPFGVDVNSGVEDEHHRKDKARVAAFVQRAKSALLNEELESKPRNRAASR